MENLPVISLMSEKSIDTWLSHKNLNALTEEGLYVFNWYIAGAKYGFGFFLIYILPKVQKYWGEAVSVWFLTGLVNIWKSIIV